MDLKTVKLNSLTLGGGKMSLFPKKVEYPFKQTKQTTSQNHPENKRELRYALKTQGKHR